MNQAYEVLKREYIEDIHADGTLLRHKKTGAVVVLLSNDDENKVFNIAFRTPPHNSTGVAHIIEHSVLCGSDKFPLKDPFVELAKGSLNTFLNAMTYPDKTMYPVASCNDTDFQNLMDVYLDAVFHPNIYKNELIFRQEGWHYHIESPEDPITYNGVVYNEMKGAFSSADEVLDRIVFNHLFPDTPYGVESGGDPEVIPELSYEEFIAFHKKYYSASNSFIYLYGNMDMDEKLAWIDAEYLSKQEMVDVNSEISLQPAFDSLLEVEEEYPILDEDPTEDNTYLSLSYVVSDASEIEKNIAFSVLEYALLDAPGAPVKQALLDAGIGSDVYGEYNDGIKQPFFSITAKNANVEDKDTFVNIIKDTLNKLVKQGIDQKALRSGINYFEFRFREADYSSYPKGLIYGINLFDSWLYDKMNPFLYIKQLAVFESLKEKISQGYYENLIRTCLLENAHGVLVTLKPKRGLESERAEKTAEKLAAYKASLSDDELQKLVDITGKLKEYQEEEDTKEAMDTIPLLKRSDIAEATPMDLKVVESSASGVKILKHPYFTNGIAYLHLLFDVSGVSRELVPYMSLLKSVLGYISTEHYNYTELFHEINGRTGGISCGLQSIQASEKGAANQFYMGVRAKYLYPSQDFVFDMIEEIIFTSNFDDEKRLKEIILSQKARLQSSLASAGHATAANRALSHFSEAAAWQDDIAGIGYLRLLEKLSANFDEEKEDLTAKLKQLLHIIFRRDNMLVSLTSENAADDGRVEENLYKRITSLSDQMYTDEVPVSRYTAERCSCKEAFKTSGQVQYVALGADFKEKGLTYTGALRILRVILNYDYLWMNIRVKGGAYGCMSAFKKSGDCYMVTYRDPHLKQSLEVFEGLASYLEKFDADEREMTKYIIGAISELDTPMNAYAKGNVSLNCYLSGITVEDFQKERDEVLQADASAIRALVPFAEALKDAAQVCVVGSEASISKHKELFSTIDSLIKS